VFDSLLAQVEVINSQSIQVQTLGAMPTISIQKTDGCQVYLSKDSMDAEIVTSKSSEMNVLVPQGDDYVSSLREVF
jgi:adenylyl cyclase-associated protein